MKSDPLLADRLETLVRSSRMIFVAGLPGTGKSLMVHQLAHLGAAAGRVVHLLQWDVARPVFEATAAGRRYPMVGGVTHPVIRKAVGLWSRRAIAEWDRRCAGPEHVLVGETPFVGNRLVELARPMDDAAEPLLAAPSCRFAIAVPSVEVRSFLEAERERRVAHPQHPREREDASPDVLRELWRDLVGVAHALGITAQGPRRDDPTPYDPIVYRRVYQALLRHRHVEILELGTILPTTAFSVYDFAAKCVDVAPESTMADAVVREIEAQYPDPAALTREVERWWTT